MLGRGKKGSTSKKEQGLILKDMELASLQVKPAPLTWSYTRAGSSCLNDSMNMT